MGLWLTLFPAIAQTPTISPLQEGSLCIIQGNSLVSRQPGAFNSEIEAYLWGVVNKYGVSYEKIWQLIFCESSWNPQAKGDNGKAFGLLQFHKPTFELYKNKYGHPEYDYYNPENQIELGAEMISNGLREQHWVRCSK